jgi:hypothetical protein
MSSTSGSTGGEREPATAAVAFVGQQQGAIDGDPILEVDLVIRRPGTADRPLATSLRVPRSQLGHLVIGAELSVALSPVDPTVLDVDWDALT